jgi:hypothetical protein
MNSAIVQPIPPSAPAPPIERHVTPCGRLATPRRTTAQAESVIPTGFPTTSPSAMPSATLMPPEASILVRPSGTSIGEGEERHDAERHRPVERVLEPEKWWLELLGQTLELLDGRLVLRILERRSARVVGNLEL